MHPHHADQCKRLIHQLYKSKNGVFFRAPVDPEALGLPDYPIIIQKPMDFGTIKDTLAQNMYKNAESFAKDVRLVFTNCCTYNCEESPIFNMAIQLSKLFEESYSKFDTSEPEVESQEEDEIVQELGGSGVSEYEKKRLQNIARNREMMKALGLDLNGLQENGIKPALISSPSPPKRKSYTKHPILAPTRSSKRKKGFQYTPLFTAVRDKNLDEILLVLMEGNCDVNEKNGINDETALHLAATLGDLDILKALLSHDGIELDVRDFRGWTPLAIAKTNGFTEICNALISSGATPFEELEPDSRRKSLPRPFISWNSPIPISPSDQNRCTCCHTCRTSLSIYPREYKGCASCPYIYCQNCFAKGQVKSSTWEEAKSNPDWICEVCDGSCVCSRCCTRGPPRWFGHKNPKWSNPDTAEIERSAYKTKAMEAHEERLATPVVAAVPQQDRRSQPYQYQQMCTCCHICRKSIASKDTPYMSCSTCAYIICKGCFGKRISQTWEEVKEIQNWSCTVCHGTCNCGRCKKRGPPGWYGQIKKMKKDPPVQSEIFREEKYPAMIQFDEVKDESLIELPLLVHHIKEECNDDTILLNIEDMLSEEAINRLSPVSSTTPVEPMEASSFMTESLMQNIFADAIDPVF